jgi:hypothetical protein
LEVFPTLEHVVCIERSTSKGPYVGVFLFNACYLLLDLLLSFLNALEFLHSFSHLLHVRRLAL